MSSVNSKPRGSAEEREVATSGGSTGDLATERASSARFDGTAGRDADLWHQDWDEPAASDGELWSQPPERAAKAPPAAAAEADAGHAAPDTDDGDDGPKRGRRRSKTIARKQMMRERRRMIAQGNIPEIVEYERPHHRADCRDDPRPCLYVSCRYHLYLDVNPVTGSIKLNFPDKEVWELEQTCALDVAERGGITLEEVGDIMNLTRERIRQVEVSGLEKLKHGDVKLHTFIDGRELQLDNPPPGRLPIVK